MGVDMGYAERMNRTPSIVCSAFALVLGATAAACGGGATPEPVAPVTPVTTSAQAPVSEPEPKAAPAAVETAPAPAPATAAEPVAEKCDGGWVCVKVSLDTRKVEKRDTKLLGDPKIESTWSKNTDGRPATFEAFSKGSVDVTLRRKPGNKNEVVVKSAKGGEIVIDRKDGTPDDFTHVGVIAAEKDGALLVDLRYLR